MIQCSSDFGFSLEWSWGSGQGNQPNSLQSAILAWQYVCVCVQDAVRPSLLSVRAANPEAVVPSTRTSKAAASSSGGAENEDTVTVGTEVLSNLVQTIELLKMEVAALKGERPRKKASAEDNDSVTSFSMAGSL